jgi:DNA-binding transcriptional ArsR family regulator
MPKVTLDRETFKALASDTRLDILRVLDGKNMSLNDICKATNLNKATLHEHLTRLHEAGLVKRKEREGHKWVYYKLSWKGEGILHPENTRIVVLFTMTFIAFVAGIMQMIRYVQGTVIREGYETFVFDTKGIVGERAGNESNETGTTIMNSLQGGSLQTTYQDPLFLYVAIACFIIFTIILGVALWRFQKNKTPKL